MERLLNQKKKTDLTYKQKLITKLFEVQYEKLKVPMFTDVFSSATGVFLWPSELRHFPSSNPYFTCFLYCPITIS